MDKEDNIARGVSIIGQIGIVQMVALFPGELELSHSTVLSSTFPDLSCNSLDINSTSSHFSTFGSDTPSIPSLPICATAETSSANQGVLDELTN